MFCHFEKAIQVTFSLLQKMIISRNMLAFNP
uniref:Uncharacterized protein n=1 Tax=Rhizophora mucronata TaxID=61149 RepID=A0A2P2R1V7_RHIMU